MANPYTEEMFQQPAPAAQEDTVATMVYDDANPGWVEVEFSSGRKATMPAEQAEALPQAAPDPAATAPAPYTAGPGGGFGPPVPPVAPEAVTPPPGGGSFWGGPEAAPGAPAPAETPVADPMTGMPLNQAAQTAVGQHPGAPNVAVQPGSMVARSTIGPDPAEVVAPATAGEFGLKSTTAGASDTTTNFVEDPDAMQSRTASAYDQGAQAARVRDWHTYQAKYGEAVAREFGARAEEDRVRRAQAQAQAEVDTNRRFIEGMEKNPIDPDEFWSASPGRTIAAWVALALSGFLQGASRGANPALAQMTNALNDAQNRWLQNKQAERQGVYARRMEALRDAKATEQSFRMQLPGLISKQMDLAAQRAGLPVPPGLETYRAAGAVESAKAMNEIGKIAKGQATKTAQEVYERQAGRGPQTRFDVELQAVLGPDAVKKHQEAMTANPDLGVKVRAAAELEQIREGLAKIAEANDGQLPAQGTASWRQLGLAPLAARLGIQNADEQVRTGQLLNQAVLSYMSAMGTVKGFDSNLERERLESIFNTGVAGSTLAAIDQRADLAEQAAVSVASGYAGGNARRYIDLLKTQTAPPPEQQREEAGKRVQFTPLGQAPAAPAGQDADADAEQVPGFGGPTPGPLAPRAAAAGASRLDAVRRALR